LVLIFSCGRTGTNLVLEILSGSKLLSPSPYPEDKQIFTRGICYPYNYLTKSDSIYCDNFGLFADFMKKNWHCKVIWTLRHPYDTAMSKIYRGWGHADDANLKGCVKDMYYMAYLYCEAMNRFPDRIMPVKMENVIRDTRKTTEQMCMFLNLTFDENMLVPYVRMRHEQYSKEYGNGIHNNVDLYKQWESIYGGFFTKIDFDLNILFEKVSTLKKTFGYEECN
jgi:hypothetical protein